MKILFSAAALLSLCQISYAQYGGTVVVPSAAPAVVNTTVEPHHASTVMESVDRGRAAVIRSVGTATRDIAAARIDLRTAERMGIDNWQQRVTAKWNIQDAYQMRLREQYKPLPPEAYRQIAREAAPKRLSSAQVAQSGALCWPKGLLDDQLIPYRDRIDSLMAARTTGMTDVGFAANCQEILLVTDALAEQLRLRIDWLPASHYVEAKKFIASVRLEGMVR